MEDVLFTKTIAPCDAPRICVGTTVELAVERLRCGEGVGLDLNPAELLRVGGNEWSLCRHVGSRRSCEATALGKRKKT